MKRIKQIGIGFSPMPVLQQPTSPSNNHDNKMQLILFCLIYLSKWCSHTGGGGITNETVYMDISSKVVEKHDDSIICVPHYVEVYQKLLL